MTRGSSRGPRSPPPIEQGDLFGKAAEPVSPLRPFSAKDLASAERLEREKAPVAPAPPPARPPPSPPVQEPPARVVLSVGELTRQIKGALENRFARVLVRGEISGFRGANVRGHLYFQLKDGEACIDAKMWATVAARHRFQLREGMEVIAEGAVDVYAPQGRYSLILHKLEPVGEGALALAFQQLKDRLAAEGLIGDRRRPPRPIPFLPRRIGIVTSRTGAALQDFLRVLYRRHPRLSVLLADSRVQGAGAAQEVVRAIGRLSRTDVDVIVLTRGGGSLEDLWTFNEESVARAIHACPVPVVSAIGHEVDFTIADFVADHRAPTPSAAAERLAPVLAELEAGLATSALRLRKAAERHVLSCRRELAGHRARLPDPRRRLGHQRLHLSTLAERMARALRAQDKRRSEALEKWLARLSRQRPQTLLARRRETLRRDAERLKTVMREGTRRRRAELARLHVSITRQAPLKDLQEEAQRVAALRLRLDSRLRERHAAESQRLRLLGERLVFLLGQRSANEHQRLARLTQTLDALSPLKVMSRGYAVAFPEGKTTLVRSASQVQPGDPLVLRFAPPTARTLSETDEVRVTVTSVRSGTSGEAADGDAPASDGTVAGEPSAS